jgi:hypothetical protein
LKVGRPSDFILFPTNLFSGALLHRLLKTLKASSFSRDIAAGKVRAKTEPNVTSLVMVMLLSCWESVMVVFVPQASASPTSAPSASVWLLLLHPGHVLHLLALLIARHCPVFIRLFPLFRCLGEHLTRSLG